MPDLPLPIVPFPRQNQMGDCPVGTVIAFAGQLTTEASPEPYQTNPEQSGWMLCDGRSLKTQYYPELFWVLGYLYGGEENDFLIPDYRGYFFRGHDPEGINDPDLNQRTPPNTDGSPKDVGSRQDDALQIHQHAYDQAPAPAQPSQSGSAAGASSPTQALTDTPTDSLPSPPGNVRVSQHETRPKNIYVNYLIKFTSGSPY